MNFCKQCHTCTLYTYIEAKPLCNKIVESISYVLHVNILYEIDRNSNSTHHLNSYTINKKLNMKRNFIFFNSSWIGWLMHEHVTLLTRKYGIQVTWPYFDSIKFILLLNFAFCYRIYILNVVMWIGNKLFLFHKWHILFSLTECTTKPNKESLCLRRGRQMAE